MGLVLDTTIPIASERRKETLRILVERISLVFGQIDLVLSAVSVVEFTHGIYRANSPEIAERRRFYSDELTRAIQVIPLSLEIAQLAGRIQGEQAAIGNSIATEDLIIGATALYLGYDVLTLNIRHFQMIPGLTVRTL